MIISGGTGISAGLVVAFAVTVDFVKQTLRNSPRHPYV